MKKLVLAATLISPSGFADVFIYDAEVISTETIVIMEQTTSREPWCYGGKPGTFSHMLRWDIGCGQPGIVEKTAYRVTYTIDDNEFTMVLKEAPGESIPVRLTLSSL